MTQEIHFAGCHQHESVIVFRPTIKREAEFMFVIRLSLIVGLAVFTAQGAQARMKSPSKPEVKVLWPAKMVTSPDGIPVYSKPDTRESSICGRLPVGEIVDVSPSPSNGFGMRRVELPARYNCGDKPWVQVGFLEDLESTYIYKASSDPKGLRRSRNFKSSVPSFSTPCQNQGRNKIIVSFVGDVLLHGALQRQAYANALGFQTTWDQLNPVFRKADIAYANLEGPAARGVNCRGQITQKDRMQLDPECRKSRSSVYTSYPMFNYHPRLTDDLKTSGFDIVSTSNNHSLDRYSNGADLTIDALNQSGLDFMGTRKKFSNDDFYTVTRSRSRGGKVFNIAWVACTFSANGIRDRENQVLNCYNYNSGGSPIFSQTNPLVLQTVRALANTRGIDGVIVTPHWGPTEYTHSVHPSQTRLAHELSEAGAVAVIGAHPHVLQPWEVIRNSSGRETFVHYSLGNFVSNQSQAPRRASIVLLVGFQKDSQDRLVVDGVRYVPTFLNRWGGRYARELVALDRRKSVNAQGRESLRNILNLYPDELRLDSNAQLTTCN